MGRQPRQSIKPVFNERQAWRSRILCGFLRAAELNAGAIVRRIGCARCLVIVVRQRWPESNQPYRRAAFETA